MGLEENNLLLAVYLHENIGQSFTTFMHWTLWHWVSNGDAETS
jgi:hypothetical protein